MRGIKGGSRLETGVGFLGRNREGKAIGVEGLRELDSWHLISLFFFYFHDYEL